MVILLEVSLRRPFELIDEVDVYLVTCGIGAFVETDLVICKHDQFTATRLHLFNIALDLLRLRAIRRHRNDAHLLVDLGIRFRLGSVSLRDEFLTQGLMVFDDAVKNMTTAMSLDTWEWELRSAGAASVPRRV